MRLRIRGPGGQSTVSIPDDATIADLKAEISKRTSITSFDIKYGYPPATLRLDEHQPTDSLSILNIRLDGEQLIVSDRAPPPPISAPSATKPVPKKQAKSAGSAPPPLSLSRRPALDDPPELPLPSRASTLLLRIMPDDNSCLFRAFNSAYFGAMDNMQELRSIIAQTIQANPDKYPAVVLEKAPDDYCRWIQSDAAWGGAIELDILSRHFQVEICSIDVQSLRVDRFNESAEKRCVLVYSGIHYDVIALSPSDPPYERGYAPPEFDEKVFDGNDEEVLDKAVELCRVLQGKHYFTDTASFSICCNVCGTLCTGERGATEHAETTGHYDFGEAA